MTKAKKNIKIDDLTTQQKAARLFRFARKRKGQTQSEFARSLGITQGAVSKIESAQSVPSAPFWLEFCEAYTIPVDSIRTGRIDLAQKITVTEGTQVDGFLLPERYARHRASSSRTCMPFLNYFEAMLGREHLAEWMKEESLDLDYFVDLGNPINLEMILELCRTLKRFGHLSAHAAPAIGWMGDQAGGHRFLFREPGALVDSFDVLNLILENSRMFEANFDYVIEEKSKNNFAFSVKPRAHLKAFHHKDDPEVGDFLCKYRRGYFQAVSGLRSEIFEKECVHRGDEKCIYTVKNSA